MARIAGMNEQLRRPWFRFSLRTLLVVVTVLCCWLAWESSVVRQRKAVRQEAANNPAFELVTAEDALRLISPSATPPQMARVSMIRRWLGDQAIQSIEYNRQYGNFSDDKLKRLTQTFPEAEVREVHIPLEPCHPGCFPRGTLVLTGAGPRPIETIQEGEWLVAMAPSGEIITAPVQSIFVTENRLWQVRTQAGELLTTETQPLLVAADEFREAGGLEPGDRILRYVDGAVASTTVLEVAPTQRIEQVINLVLGDCEAFVAGEGYFARSKPPERVATR